MNKIASNNKIVEDLTIAKSSKFHYIWLLPIITLIVCIGLLWHLFTHQGNNVIVKFNNADGIIAGKTVVKYSGVTIGLVKNIHFTKNLKQIEAHIKINKPYKSWLNTKTTFWLVKPNLSISGITGLETIISGNYIAMKPGENGKFINHFIALKTHPIDNDTNGLRISLLAKKLYSITLGSPVYFNQVQVGKVINYEINPQNNNVLIHLFIKSKYANLVYHNSRFWNVSGFKVEANLKGIKVQTESLTALIKGGIAFYTPAWEENTSIAKNGEHFILYDAAENKQFGIKINIHFPLQDNAITKGTLILFHGLEIGKVINVTINNDLKHFNAQAIIDPTAKNILTKDTHFWIIHSQAKLKDIFDIASLIRGSYIEVDTPIKTINTNLEYTYFNGQENRLQNLQYQPGLNFTLKSTTLDGFDQRTPILYKGLSIGHVVHIRLSDNAHYILLSVNILPQYKHLINKTSYFFNSSGFSLNASLSSGLNFKSESLSSLISGGITVNTPNSKGSPIDSNTIFTLHNSVQANGLKLLLINHNLGSITKGTPILYLGIPVGQVTGYYLDYTTSQVVTEILIHQPYRRLVTKESKFWNISGVQIDGSAFSGIQFKAHSLKTIMNGGIAFATPSNSDKKLPANTRFTLYNEEKKIWNTWHPNININP